MLTVNAMTAADSVLIPVQPQFYSTDGLMELLKVYQGIKNRFNPEIELEEILYTMDSSRYNNSKRNKKAVQDAYGSKVHIFENSIPRSETMAEIASEGVSIFSYDKLGKEYTKERIKERIDSGLERNYKIKPKERVSKALIDVNQEKFVSSPGLKKWAAVENLKNIAESYDAAGSLVELEQKLAVVSSETLTAKSKLRQIENHVKSLQEIMKYANQYQPTLSIYQSYKKNKKSRCLLSKT